MSRISKKIINLGEIVRKIKQIPVYFLVFLAFIFLLPIQTRLVWFFPESHLGKAYIFYNTVFLFGTDFLILLAIVFLLVELKKRKFHIKQQFFDKKIIFLLILGIIVLISIIVSQETNYIIQIFALFKLFLVIALFSFMINEILVKLVKQYSYTIFWLILGISIFEVFIGISQYFLQHSLGLRLLGEEVIKPGMAGVAGFKLLDGSLWVFDRVFNVSRETFIMRPYGTFPHPNVFGAFMGFVTVFSYFLFLGADNLRKKIIFGAMIFAQIFALAISFSRVAICAWVLESAVWFTLIYFSNSGWIKKMFSAKPSPARNIGELRDLKRNLTQLLLLVLFSSVIIGLILFPQFLERGGVVSYGTTNDEAISDRLLYQEIAVNMIKKQPLFGVGYQNFVMAMDEYSPVILMPYQHQPVHNIYLLVASETGLLGLAAFLLFIFFVIKSALSKPLTFISVSALAVFAGFLFIGLFDHYLLTIQQGRLMFFLVAGFLVAGSLAGDEKKASWSELWAGGGNDDEVLESGSGAGLNGEK